MLSFGRSWGDTPPAEPHTGIVRRAAAVAGLAALLGVAGMGAATAASAATSPGGTGTTTSGPPQHEPNGRSWS